MWETKTFKTREAFDRWTDRNCRRFWIVEIAVNNAYGVTYRPLRRVY